MSDKRRAFDRFSDFLFRHPIDALLEAMVHGAWLRRILVAAAVALAFYWQARWSTIGIIVAVWLAYEALYWFVRYVTRSWRS
jgi:hypothetical protein